MLSVVVCVRNEEHRLRECLETVYLNAPDEVIVVDGGSTDATLEVAREFPGIVIVESPNSTLPRDRQRGIDVARHDLVAMVDADHRLLAGDLRSLLGDMDEFGFDIVQSGLISFENKGFWDRAEEEAWELTQNIPGRRTMVGSAPAIFHRRVFQFARFDDHITSTIEDTDFAYRLSKFPALRFGVGRTKIRQFHFADLSTFVKKFQWYGMGGRRVLSEESRTCGEHGFSPACPVSVSTQHQSPAGAPLSRCPVLCSAGCPSVLRLAPLLLGRWPAV